MTLATASPSPRTISDTASGRRTSRSVLEPVRAEFADNRVTYRYKGISEWYINTPEGVEQGFEIPERPAGTGARGGSGRPRVTDVLDARPPHELDELYRREQFFFDDDDVDGIFFNMGGYQTSDYSRIQYGLCHCPACRRRFREMYGLDLPERVTGGRRPRIEVVGMGEAEGDLLSPALVAVLQSPHNQVQGFLAAGHVCTVTGMGPYRPITERFRVPIVATGFVLRIAAGEVHEDD